VTEGEIRSLAVEVVDLVHGYTYEFSNQQETHLQEYDDVEDLLRQRLRAKPWVSAADRIPEMVTCTDCGFALDDIRHYGSLHATESPDTDWTRL